jgi:hypothetical protein
MFLFGKLCCLSGIVLHLLALLKASMGVVQNYHNFLLFPVYLTYMQIYDNISQGHELSHIPYVASTDGGCSQGKRAFTPISRFKTSFQLRSAYFQTAVNTDVFQILT